MKVAIHQPHYWPWQGFLEKWRRADLLIVLDTVTFTKGGWQNRCRLQTPHGDKWLTVPVHAPGVLAEIQVAGDHWRRVHDKTLAWAVPARAERARAIYAQPWDRLAELALATMTTLAPDRPWCWASTLGVTETEPTARLVALCQAVGATTYLHGAGAAAYMRPDLFAAAGITLEPVVGVWPPYTALQAA